MIDTVKLYSREFSLPKNHRFTQNLLVNSEGEVVSTGGWKFPICEGWAASVLEKSGSRLLFVDGSLPKLLYKTSLREVTESDYERAVDLLTTGLTRSGLDLPSKPFESALRLSRVDFCKNIQVNHSLPSYLAAFSEYNFSRQDKSQWNAETLLWSNTRREFTLYDKVADCIAKENNPQVAKSLSSMPHNILRIENRYKRGVEVKKVVGSGESVKLSEVFDGDLSRRVLTGEVSKLLRSEKPVVGSGDLASMIKREGGKVRNVINSIGARGILEQVGYDGDRLVSLFIGAGTARSTAFRYRSRILHYAAHFVPLEASLLIAEVREKLAA